MDSSRQETETPRKLGGLIVQRRFGESVLLHTTEGTIQIQVNKHRATGASLHIKAPKMIRVSRVED